MFNKNNIFSCILLSMFIFFTKTFLNLLLKYTYEVFNWILTLLSSLSGFNLFKFFLMLVLSMIIMKMLKGFMGFSVIKMIKMIKMIKTIKKFIGYMKSTLKSFLISFYSSKIGSSMVLWLVSAQNYCKGVLMAMKSKVFFKMSSFYLSLSSVLVSVYKYTLKMLKSVWNLLFYIFYFSSYSFFSGAMVNTSSFEGHLYSVGGLKFMGYYEDVIFESLLIEISEYLEFVGATGAIPFMSMHVKYYEMWDLPVECVMETFLLLKCILVTQDFTNESLMFWIVYYVLSVELSYWCDSLNGSSVQNSDLFDLMVTCVKGLGFKFSVLKNYLLVSYDDSESLNSYYVSTSGEFTTFCEGILKHYHDTSMEMPLDFMSSKTVKFSSVIFLEPFMNPKIYDVFYTTEFNGISLTPWKFIHFNMFDCASLYYCVLVQYQMSKYYNFHLKEMKDVMSNLWFLSSSSDMGIYELNSSLVGHMVLGYGKKVFEGAVLKNTSYNLNNALGINNDNVFVVVNHLEKGVLEENLGELSVSSIFKVLDSNSDELKYNCLNFFNPAFFMGKVFYEAPFPFYTSYSFKSCAMLCWTQSFGPASGSGKEKSGLEDLYDMYTSSMNTLKSIPENCSNDTLMGELGSLEESLKTISYYLFNSEMSLGVYVCSGSFKDKNCYCQNESLKLEGASKICLCNKEYFLEKGLFKENTKFLSSLSLPSPTFIEGSEVVPYLDFLDPNNLSLYEDSKGFLESLVKLLQSFKESMEGYWENQLSLSSELESGAEIFLKSGVIILYFSDQFSMLVFNNNLITSSGVEVFTLNSFEGLIALYTCMGQDSISGGDLIMTLSSASSGEMLDSLTDPSGVLNFKTAWEDWISKMPMNNSSSLESLGLKSKDTKQFSLESSMLGGFEMSLSQCPEVMSSLPINSFCYMMSEMLKKMGSEDLKYLKELKDSKTSSVNFFYGEWTTYYLTAVVFILEFKDLNISESEKISLKNNNKTTLSFLNFCLDKEESKEESSVGYSLKVLFEFLFDSKYSISKYFDSLGWDKFATWKKSGVKKKF